ncbi:CotY/CotZ family spore coat protein [Bacillus sp. FJAT-27231]|uniref:CotY/CotZ family spore coat protein n=1 Tax=Bacillus sp. FJAT-27231 TaxID=1679168 RepID=UPI0006715A1F|nr:CotY/CotZ family spore coat protein [Bacillus sp. FJAT-27231]
MDIAGRLRQIYLLQQAIEEPRFLSKMFLHRPLKSTVPFLLYLKDGSTFQSFGNIGKLKGIDCFATPFFSVEYINEDEWVTLQLLKPYGEHKIVAADICSTSRLEKTSFRVEVHTGLFGGLQILDSRLID